MRLSRHSKLLLVFLLLGFCIGLAHTAALGDSSSELDLPTFNGTPSDWIELEPDIPTGTRFMLFDNYGGWWADAEKNPAPGDDLLCWAGTSSNILEWTGWGYVYYMDHGDTDDFFQYYQNHVTDAGQYISLGLQWWLNGNLDNEGDSAAEDVPHAGFWPGYNPEDYIWKLWETEDIMPELRAEIILGKAAGLTIYSIAGTGAHAVTVWGLNYDPDLEPDDPEYYLGIWITDSDNDKDNTTPDDVLTYYKLDYNYEENYWYMPSYGLYDGWYIGSFAAMAPFPGDNRPVASGGPYVGYEGTPLVFTHTSTDDDGDPLEFRIDHNADGIWDTQWAFDSTQKTFYDDYEEDVIIEVFDGRLRDVCFTTITIENVAPTIDIGEDRHVNEGDNVPFWVNIEDPGLDTHTIEWNFGDGATAVDDRRPTHIYAEEGHYPVSVMVTDDDGGMANWAITVYVENSAPVVDAGPDQIVNQGETVHLNGDFTDPGNDVENWWWDFADGSVIIRDELSPDHIFLSEHNYPVTFSVMDSGGAVSVDVVNIKVLNVPPTVEAGDDLTAEVGEVVSFEGSFTDPGLVDTHTATVNYGDGSGNINLGTVTSPISGLSHTYTDSGVYTVTLQVQDYYGGEDIDTLTVTVESHAPIVYAGPDQTINEGDTVEFKGSYTDDEGAPWTIYWDFDDGNTPIEGILEPIRVFYGNKIYSVTLTVTDFQGNVGEDNVLVTVNNVEPVVELGSETDKIHLGTLFYREGSFIDPGIGPWTATLDYGEGDGEGSLELIDNNIELSHEYSESGVYTITVKVTDDKKGVGEATITVTVSNEVPSVEIGTDTTINEGSAFTRSGSFTDSDPDTWIATVDYGDGEDPQSLSYDADKSFELSHTYNDDGTYIVTVRIEDNVGGFGEDSLTVTVNNVPPTIEVLEYSQPNQDIILPIVHTLDFYAEYTKVEADVVTILWDMGDGTVIPDTLTPQHAYQNPGEYTVTLTVMDEDGGSDTEYITVLVETLGDIHQLLDTQISEILPEYIKGNSEQKIIAFQKMIAAISNMLEEEIYDEAISFLTDNLLPKVNGEKNNCWVIDAETQILLTQIIEDYIAYLQTLI